MSIPTTISKLEAAGLVQVALLQPELQYQFRHTLLYEAAYSSLVRQDRKELHNIVGQTLETLYPEQQAELAAILAMHFEKAGNYPKARKFYEQAGDLARQKNAIPEALLHYSSAIQVSEKSNSETAALHCQRGQLYEILGNYRCARSDYLTGLKIARQTGNRNNEWRALILLGQFWAARNYRMTGGYYDRALHLARSSDDAVMLAHSLNHLANWHINREQPGEALELHQEALQIFTDLDDQEGKAHTFDYLAMANMMAGRTSLSRNFYDEAIELFLKQQDFRGVANSLAGYTVLSPVYQIAPIADEEIAEIPFDENMSNALDSARRVHWRSGELFIRSIIAEKEGFLGRYQQALDGIDEALVMAVELSHHQWLTSAHCIAGFIYLDLLFFEEARRHLEFAFSLATKIQSSFWLSTCAGPLAEICILQKDEPRAEEVLSSVKLPDGQAQSVGQYSAWCAWALLALYRQQIEVVFSSLAHIPPTSTGDGMKIAWIKSLAYLESKQLEQAEQSLARASLIASQLDARPMLWRIAAAQSALLRAQGRGQESTASQDLAFAIIHQLADNLLSPEQKSRYLDMALLSAKELSR